METDLGVITMKELVLGASVSVIGGSSKGLLSTLFNFVINLFVLNR